MIGQTFQIDLGSSLNVKTIYTALSWERVRKPRYNIYIGEADIDASYNSQNKLCYTGPEEGVALCEGQGKYIIWELQNNIDMAIAEIMVYDKLDRA